MKGKGEGRVCFRCSRFGWEVTVSFSWHEFMELCQNDWQTGLVFVLLPSQQRIGRVLPAEWVIQVLYVVLDVCSRGINRLRVRHDDRLIFPLLHRRWFVCLPIRGAQLFWKQMVHRRKLDSMHYLVRIVCETFSVRYRLANRTCQLPRRRQLFYHLKIGQTKR